MRRAKGTSSVDTQHGRRCSVPYCPLKRQQAIQTCNMCKGRRTCARPTRCIAQSNTRENQHNKQKEPASSASRLALTTNKKQEQHHTQPDDKLATRTRRLQQQPHHRKQPSRQASQSNLPALQHTHSIRTVWQHNSEQQTPHAAQRCTKATPSAATQHKHELCQKMLSISARQKARQRGVSMV